MFLLTTQVPMFQPYVATFLETGCIVNTYIQFILQGVFVFSFRADPFCLVPMYIDSIVHLCWHSGKDISFSSIGFTYVHLLLHVLYYSVVLKTCWTLEALKMLLITCTWKGKNMIPQQTVISTTKAHNRTRICNRKNVILLS